METIEIDFDVWKELTIRRKNENVTYNDVIRNLLGLKEKNNSRELNKSYTGIPFISEGVTFPHGTEFRKKYKGQYFFGEVENGFLVINGKKFSNPSPAAMYITQNQVNGWIFWECKFPGKLEWIKIRRLRKS